MTSKAVRGHVQMYSIWLLFWLFAGAMQAVQAADGRIFNLQGDVKLNGETVTGVMGITRGDEIVTGRQGSARVVMRDRTVLDIRPSTRFKFNQYKYNARKPKESRSVFGLLKGSFRYISGLIAKTSPKSVSVRAGNVATIGIRGTFASFSYDADTKTVTADSAVGVTVITMPGPDGQPVVLTVERGQTGQIVEGSARGTVGDTTDVSNVVKAAQALAVDPTNGAALDGLSEGEKALVLAALINNRESYGVDQAAIQAVLGTLVASESEAAALFVFVGTVLDPDNAEAYTATAIQEAPDKADEINESVIDAIDFSQGEPGGGEPATPVQTGGESAPTEGGGGGGQGGELASGS